MCAEVNPQMWFGGHLEYWREREVRSQDAKTSGLSKPIFRPPEVYLKGFRELGRICPEASGFRENWKFLQA